jgi:predicted phosphoadenosine phosphosulfate sulfurtransferase
MTINKKDRLLISFSGGETSGYMTSLLLKNNHDEDLDSAGACSESCEVF